MKWQWIEEYSYICKAETSIGTYSIHQDEDSAGGRLLCYLHLTEDGNCTKYAIEIYSGYEDEDYVQRAAEEDFRTRVGVHVSEEVQRLRRENEALQAIIDDLEDDKKVLLKAAGDYCWHRYKDRQPAMLKSSAVFTSHEWQKITEAMEAHLAQHQEKRK